nr:hypothetical protein [Tanacetum cinerariifolium]
MAKLLAENEKLNKENEHLKQTYKELFDLRIHTKDHNDSLIAQVNSKTVENADLKAQIQEKGNRFYNHTELLRAFHPAAVDPAGSPSSTTIDQDIPSASSSPTTQEIQSQVTHQEVIKKQARNVQTSLTMSSAKLEIQLMVDVPIHQEDPAVQRTLLIDTIISMVTDKKASTPTPPTTQAHVQICLTFCWKYISRGV